jgi:cytochrome d ubiquinol oxidase subunit II
VGVDLPALWFGVTVVAWVLFFVLEGFDFGVGMLAGLGRRTAAERDAAVRTIGPVWDGNEVWLVAAVGLMFGAFPDWYAATLSGLYLPMVLVLLTLAVRGVALEFRGKVHGDGELRWKRRCDLALGWSSALTAGLWGAILTVLARGLAIGPDGEVTGGGVTRSLGPVLTLPALAGAVAGIGAALLMGALFLGLRTSGPLRGWARAVALRCAAGLTAAGVAASVLARQPGLVVPTAALAVAGVAVLRRREGVAFAAGATAVAAAVLVVFTGRFPILLPSTLDAASSLTLDGAAASPAALQLLTVAGAVVLPGVVAYQALSYWVFRRRVSSERIATPGHP